MVNDRMDLKKWREYSAEEKHVLLQHWFLYYGRLFYTEAEYVEFERLIEMDSDLMFDVACSAFMVGCGAQAFIVAMRTNGLAYFLNSVLTQRSRPEYPNWFERASSNLLCALVRTYNAPQCAERVFVDSDLERQTQKIIALHMGRF